MVWTSNSGSGVGSVGGRPGRGSVAVGHHFRGGERGRQIEGISQGRVDDFGLTGDRLGSLTRAALRRRKLLLRLIQLPGALSLRRRAGLRRIGTLARLAGFGRRLFVGIGLQRLAG